MFHFLSPEIDRDIDLSIRGSLASRLKLDPKKDIDFSPLPGPLLRKYIAYAKNFVFPRSDVLNSLSTSLFFFVFSNEIQSCLIRMSKPAADILQKFYLRLRDHNSSADGTPITARQLESLVRLAEARARLDLREEITDNDALVGIKRKTNSTSLCLPCVNYMQNSDLTL